MFLLVLILIGWLIALQITVNGLSRKIDELSGISKPKKSPATPPVFTPGNNANANPPVFQPKPQPEAAPQDSKPAFTPPQPARVFPAPAPSPSKPNFEFTTAQLFAWTAGFMLFLGCVFGLKYVVEKDLLSPALRILLSTGLGLALAVAGYRIKEKKYRVLAHTLLGSGIAIVYAAIFCAHTFYDFISLPLAFILMAVTSFGAMSVSLQKDAKYIGYLGAIIAFLTPILLNNGSGAWVAFFLYVFCINAAAAYAAVQKGWNGLLICTLSFTWLSQTAWLFPIEHSKLLGVVTFFSLYAVSAAWLARRHKVPSVISYAVGGFLTLGLLLMLPAAGTLADPSLAGAPSLLLQSFELLGYVLLVNVLILFLAGKGEVAPFFAAVAKVLSFLILCTWLLAQSSALPLWLTLGVCVLFTAVNSGVELFLGQGQRKPDGFSVFYPVAVMGGLIILAVVGQNATLNFISIFGILGLLLASTLVLAVFAGILWVGFVAAALLFLFLLICLLLGIGGDACSLLVLVSGFVPLLLCPGVFFALRRAGRLIGIPAEEKVLGMVTSLTPFVLILTVIATAGEELSVHGLFAATLAVCALTALAARLYKNTFTLPAAAVGAGIVQLALWGHPSGVIGAAPAGIVAGWLCAFLALFISIPFLDKKNFWEQPATWAACALSGLSTCLMGCLLIEKHFCGNISGLVPAALLVLYAFLLYKLWGRTRTPQAHPVSIACMSGAALVFLTVFFPLQIHNHWLWVAWGAEATALIYLYKQLPYAAWKICSAGLLGVISFALLLGGNFTPVPDLCIWNWYLWVYGLCAGALFITGNLWPQNSEWKNAFYTLGGCMLFWLLNIEIAHYFGDGSHLSFAFTGELAQALTYTLAWALFSVTTIGIGLWLQKALVSKIGVVIMGLALLKFFLSDIWQLQAIYRILGLFGLAILLIIASFWYQKKQKVQ